MNVIIDYNVGNIMSVQRGFERAGIKTILSNEEAIIKKADVLILPGVGAFKDAMCELKSSGLIPLIEEHVKNNKPLIGICLGMQLLFEESEEFGVSQGLGFIDGRILELKIPYKVPHMGWNSLTINKPDLSVNKVSNGDYVYFVHSFYADTAKKNVIAYTDYGLKIPAIVRKNNIIGMQFHPEKSGAVGLRLLQNIKELVL